MTDRPDFFTHVHQGLRRALFDANTALVRARGNPEAERRAYALLDDALLFVRRHGENEDELLLPLLAERAPEIAAKMRLAHEHIEAEFEEILSLREAEAETLSLRFSLFIAHYLEHMHEEELEFEPRIREVVTAAEIAAESQRAVLRVDPGERLRMLRLMIPALPEGTARGMLAKMPEPVARELATLDPRLAVPGNS